MLGLLGSISGKERKIPYVARCDQKKKKSCLCSKSITVMGFLSSVLRDTFFIAWSSKVSIFKSCSNSEVNL